MNSLRQQHIAARDLLAQQQRALAIKPQLHSAASA
jgi:hypothetical protein